ncbi:MAG: alpha/beta hydrolase [Chitinophagales bacterium]
MQEKKTKRKLPFVIRWILWVLLVQFLLINISASLYGYKFTHFYDPSSSPPGKSAENIFAKTWRLFRGPHFFRSPVTETPQYPYDTVKLFTKDHIEIEGWYIPADSAKGTVIIIHGLGGNKGMMLDYAYECREMNFNVMMIDLRAHGNSGGHTTTLGVNESEDVKLAYDFVVNKGEKNIVMYGFSLGAVAIVKSVYDYSLEPAGVIIDAPFASLQDHLRGRARTLIFPSEPFATLVTCWAGIERGFNGFNHNTCRYVKKIHCPVLLQYGAKDKLVLKEETDCVFSHIGSADKKLVEYENAGHEYLFRNDPLKWRTEVGNFLNASVK